MPASLPVIRMNFIAVASLACDGVFAAAVMSFSNNSITFEFGRVAARLTHQFAFALPAPARSAITEKLFIDCRCR